ncbi:hypothetical protein [Sorangium sp. So ce363]|uniref:hypothetical protein n=1 Tax=Sorangium sp. So ce363 TaxID=3133304 RepID=UPI003F5E058E
MALLELRLPRACSHVQRQYCTGYLGPYIVYGIKAIGLDATKGAPLIASGLLDPPGAAAAK